MIEHIIHFSIKNKFIVGLFVVALIGWGTYSLTKLPIDAIPDITNNQVQIISVAPSLAVQEVESFIHMLMPRFIGNLFYPRNFEVMLKTRDFLLYFVNKEKYISPRMG